jgi:hypothetical protein
MEEETRDMEEEMRRSSGFVEEVTEFGIVPHGFVGFVFESKLAAEVAYSKNTSDALCYRMYA